MHQENYQVMVAHRPHFGSIQSTNGQIHTSKGQDKGKMEIQSNDRRVSRWHRFRGEAKHMSMDLLLYMDRFVCEDQIYWDRHWKRNDQLFVGGRTDLLSAEVMKDKTD